MKVMGRPSFAATGQRLAEAAAAASLDPIWA
jgi:hypothetical protein